ncbi:unnamed protein product [Phytophthora fragariaefolia]|uniref:Unnamed protein product n=1 Tax=Phytophthora fragariaefolia TaxID=1490495 RepID=A0A9W6XGS7_9STRA|nr:unnamed protein product [Phytophthora fragariaefolia]
MTRSWLNFFEGRQDAPGANLYRGLIGAEEVDRASIGAKERWQSFRCTSEAQHKPEVAIAHVTDCSCPCAVRTVPPPGALLLAREDGDSCHWAVVNLQPRARVLVPELYGAAPHVQPIQHFAHCIASQAMRPVLAGVPDVVALASYGATIRPRANSAHIRATDTGRRSSSAPLLEAKPSTTPPTRSVRSKMTIAGVSALLVASVFVLVNSMRVPVFDQSITSLAEMPMTSVGSASPSQVHVAFGSEVAVPSYSAMRASGAAAEIRLGMTISWATEAKTATSSVRYGLSKSDLSTVQQAEEPCEQYDFCKYTSPWLHHVTIPGDKLPPDTTYFCE